MRYIKKVQSENTQTVIEYKGRPMRGSFYTKNGYIPYEGTLPVSRLYIDDNNNIIELDPPGPTKEEMANALREELLNKTAMFAIDINDDTTALKLAQFGKEWAKNTPYEAKEVINHLGIAYRVITTHTSLEHQPPDAEGMLAIYRPLNNNAGTKEDPKPFIYGMDVDEGKYYSYEGNIYLAKLTMPACVYTPGTEGLWQWELQN